MVHSFHWYPSINILKEKALSYAVVVVDDDVFGPMCWAFREGGR